jgi:paraquat-inducible protein B
MTKPDDSTQSPSAPVPEAVAAPRRRWRIPLVWLVPLIAALAGGWLAVRAVLDKGPTVTITFRTAEGIEATKTRVRYRDIDIGVVTKVALREDTEAVVVTAKLQKEATRLLVDDSQFWVVRPRISGGGISGLGTLVSGAYIGMDVGKSVLEQRDFIGLEVPPVLVSGMEGREFTLRAEDLGSIGFGTPIYFRRVQVGSVTAFRLDPDGRGATVRIFINDPYDQFVKTGSRFWHASGLDVNLGADGITVDMESVTSLIVGGLAFSTPPFAQNSATAPQGSTFKLYASRTDALREPDSVGEQYVLVFAESVRGLKPGAVVEFRGIPIGEVADISTRYGRSKDRIDTPVQITIYPERLLRRSKEKATSTPEQRRATMDRLVAAGMRAQLRIGNLLTGQLYVALDYVEDAPPGRIDWSSAPPQLPTSRGQLEELQSTLASIAKKLDSLPYDQLVSELRGAIASLDSTLKSAEAVAKKLGNDVAPDVQSTLADTRATLAAARRTMATDSALQVDLQTTMREVSAAARALRELAETLERRPEALLRGKPEPKGETP